MKTVESPVNTSHGVRETCRSDLSGYLGGVGVAAVEDLLVVVHPDLGQAHLVAGDDRRAFGEGVRALGAENVAHHRARDNLQLTAALPHLWVWQEALKQKNKRKP